MPDAFRPGNDEDFDRLYRSQYPRLLRTAALMLNSVDEADDCVQEAFVNAYRSWSRWRPEAPADAWLWRILLNTTRSHLRRRRLRSATELVRRLGRPADLTANPEDQVGDSEVVALLRNLPQREAATLVMRHVHGMSLAEIAAVLGVDVRSVTRILGRAATRVRQQMERRIDV